jgi:hypothetical protein
MREIFEPMNSVMVEDGKGRGRGRREKSNVPNLAAKKMPYDGGALKRCRSAPKRAFEPKPETVDQTTDERLRRKLSV